MFCGIETPELGALDAMRKSHNNVMPLLDAVATINSYGIEVVSGIILGLDTDTPATAANLIEFIDRSQIPVLTINLLQALPKTPLWDRLSAAGRLSIDPGRESNVVFLRSYSEVIGAGAQRSGMPTRRRRCSGDSSGTCGTPIQTAFIRR